MNKRILIIDDEADLRSPLKRALTSNCYDVEEAGNLKQGFELFHKTSPDVVMLDVNLPDGNGTDYINKFKTDNTIVLLMSADNDHLQNDFSELGAGGFIKKPFIMSELLIFINKCTNATS